MATNDSLNKQHEPPLIRIKHICENNVRNFYEGLLFPALKSFWRYLKYPIGIIIQYILLPPFVLYFLLWELIKYPIIKSSSLISEKYEEHVKSNNPYVQWYIRNRMESFAALGVLATAFTLAISFIFAQTLLLGDIDFNIENPNNPQIVFLANLIDIDSTARTFTIDWYPGPLDPDNCGDNLEFVANIFLDRNLLDVTNPSNEAGADDDSTSNNPFSSTAPSNAITFQYNSTQACATTASFLDSKNTFRTVSKLGDLANNKKGRSTLQAYPLDQYIAQVSMFAIDNLTGSSIPMSIGLTWGTVVNFKAVLDRSPQGSFVDGESGGIYLLFDISRSEAVKLFVYSVVLTNWIVTNAFLWLSVACLLWNNEKIVREMFVLPVTALFAFTTVRANLPGAPAGFGAYVDFVGILPNLILLTFSSAATLMTVLGRRIYKEIIDKRELEDEDENENEKNGVMDKNDVSMLVTVVASEIRKKIELDAEGVKKIKEVREEEGSSDEEGDSDKGDENNGGKRKKYKEYFIMRPKRVTKYSAGNRLRRRNTNRTSLTYHSPTSTRPPGPNREMSENSTYKSGSDFGINVHTDIV